METGRLEKGTGRQVKETGTLEMGKHMVATGTQGKEKSRQVMGSCKGQREGCCLREGEGTQSLPTEELGCSSPSALSLQPQQAAQRLMRQPSPPTPP